MLFKLPKWQQYGISLLVVLVVVVIAWMVGKDDPAPPWLSEVVVPNLGWVYLGLLAIVIVDRIRRHKAKNKKEPNH